MGSHVVVWSHGGMESLEFRRSRDGCRIAIAPGPGMHKKKFDDAVKTVMEHMADNRDVLVHCREGTDESGCLVCFVFAVIFRTAMSGTY